MVTIGPKNTLAKHCFVLLYIFPLFRSLRTPPTPFSLTVLAFQRVVYCRSDEDCCGLLQTFLTVGMHAYQTKLVSTEEWQGAACGTDMSVLHPLSTVEFHH